MSDNNEEYPETGTGGEGITLVTDPGRTKNAVEQNESTTSQMGHASEGGKFMTPSPPNGGEGKTAFSRHSEVPDSYGVYSDLASHVHKYFRRVLFESTPHDPYKICSYALETARSTIQNSGALR
jgi:hypothetical protein